MISIKKLMEQNSEELFHATLHSYRSALKTMGESGMQACPSVGSALRQTLLRLQASLGGEPTPALVESTRQKVEAEITEWGCGAADYFKQRAAEVKELMMILAQTAEVVGERDQRYTRRFHEFTDRLQAIADLHDLEVIRDSLVKSATDLRACAEAMAQEAQQSVTRLRADLSLYQARLDDAERLAAHDPLTGLDNRRQVESSIEYRIRQQKPFSVLLLDLNGFKRVNDSCGHLAADELLKQFSAELKSGFRATDVVGRWGGDEFIVVLDGGRQDATAHVERISRWVFGDYTIPVGDARRKIGVSAAIGIAEWQVGDTLRNLLNRADAAMYREKQAGVNSRR